MAPLQFLSTADVIRLHANSMRLDGGLDGVRDHGLLEAAVAMPRQQFGGAYLHDSPAAMAAAYLFHLAMNHPFHDGNKRVAAMAAFAFLRGNGFTFRPEANEFRDVVLSVAASVMSKAALTAWLEKQVGRRDE